MFNFYLAALGYENANRSQMEESFIALNEIIINGKSEDNFLKCNTFYETKTIEGLFTEVISNFSDGQLISTVYKLLESIPSKHDFCTLDEIDALYQDKYNAFWGAYFAINNERHLNTEQKYRSFKQQKIQQISTGTDIWEKRTFLFEKVILCPQVEAQLQSMGYAEQILKKLLELDRYCIKYWNIGNFNYRDANKKAALSISPESLSTMNDDKKKAERMFKLPNGRTECFELHIKTGNLRFHFFPENLKIYIGYIGVHLSI